jgi:hypothetical protein
MVVVDTDKTIQYVLKIIYSVKIIKVVFDKKETVVFDMTNPYVSVKVRTKERTLTWCAMQNLKREEKKEKEST